MVDNFYGIRKILIKFIWLADLLLVILLIPAAYLCYFYRRAGSSRLILSTWLFRRIGVFPIINNYYEPLFQTNKLKNSLLKVRDLPGINLNYLHQLKILHQMRYANELIEMNLNNSPQNIFDFKLGNGSFESGDAEYLYQFIRYFKPRKIIEIGSGNSTKMASKALQKNFLEDHLRAEHICIEPYEMEWLESMNDVIVIREKVEDLSLDWNQTLDSRDLLFIDSSHIIRPQGDVLMEILEIIPRLKSGVFIHIHDIFTPRDYLNEWVVNEIKFWNEQYIVEALLSHTNRYEIIAALNYLKNDHFESLKKVCPYLDKTREPGSLYLRVL